MFSKVCVTESLSLDCGTSFKKGGLLEGHWEYALEVDIITLVSSLTSGPRHFEGSSLTSGPRHLEGHSHFSMHSSPQSSVLPWAQVVWSSDHQLIFSDPTA